MVGEYSGTYGGFSRPLPMLVLAEGTATIRFQADETVQKTGFVIEISSVINAAAEPRESPAPPGSARIRSILAFADFSCCSCECLSRSDELKLTRIMR